jgi:hypothetical protein
MDGGREETAVRTERQANFDEDFMPSLEIDDFFIQKSVIL